MNILIMSLPKGAAFCLAFRAAQREVVGNFVSHRVCMQDPFCKKQTQTQAMARGLKSDCCDFKSEKKTC